MNLKSLLISCALLAPAIFYGQSHSVHSVISQYNETNVVLSPDAQSIYFTLSNHPLNTGGKKDKGDIWYSTRNSDGTWQLPLRLAGTVNNFSNNRVVGFSPDGLVMYLHGNYSNNASGISLSRWNGRLWTDPQPVKIPYFKNESEEQSGYISKDGEVMLLSIQSFNTQGNEDIYVSFKTDNGFTEPRNLGPVINSKFQEFTPSLSSDQKILFFSTNGKKGFGSSDVYFSRRLDDSWTNWSEPENMGEWINGEGKDSNFILIDELKNVLLVKMNNSDEYGDIVIKSPDPKMDSLFTKPAPAELKDILVESTANPRLKGTIRDQAGQLLTSVQVQIEGKGLNDFAFSDKVGVYDFEFSENGEYSIHVSASSYIPQSAVATFSDTDKLKIIDFTLMPVEVGVSVNLDNVLFVRGTNNFTPGSTKALDLVVEFMKDNPSVEILLGGHTDNTGSERKNVTLSKQRVKTVKKYLVTQGIASSRVKGKGYGGSVPIASNDREDSRKLNRRVEFTITKN